MEEHKHAGNSQSQGFKIPYGLLFVFLGALAISYVFFAYGKDVEGLSLEGNVALPLLFAFGLVTGLHCVGMCGSFVVAYSTKEAGTGHEISQDYGSHLKYGAGKVISYTLMGGIFGLIGSVITFTPELRGGIGVLAGIFLIIYGLNILNILPVLRKLQLRLPSFAGMEKTEGKGPFAIGLANGLFLTCGPLQAMYIYAAGTGSAVNGALALLAFGTGTLPFMMLFGLSLSSLAKHIHKIVKFSGVLVVVLGLVMANTGLTLLGHGINLGRLQNNNTTNSTQSENVQIIKMTVDAAGWTPDTFVLKKGVPVKWIIEVKQLTSCNNEILVKDYGLDIKLKQGENVVEFTPTKEGTVHWSCWMGMIPGTFIVQ